MKKLLVLGRFVSEHEPVRLKEEGVKAGMLVDVVKYGQVGIGVKKTGVEIDLGKGRKLEDYDLVVLRAASKRGSSMLSVKTVILSELRRLGKKVINGDSFWEWPLLGKIEQGVEMAKAGLPTIPLVAFGSGLGWKKYLAKKINFPVMVKGRFGSHGRMVRMVSNKEELNELVASYKEGNVLVQPVLPIKQWYRCIVVNNKYLGQMRHRQKKKYLHPYLAGKEYGLIKFNKKKMAELKRLCVNVSMLFQCDYCGIDVGWDEVRREWVVFETNRTAQFKYFEKRTGVNVAAELVS